MLQRLRYFVSVLVQFASTVDAGGVVNAALCEEQRATDRVPGARSRSRHEANESMARAEVCVLRFEVVRFWSALACPASGSPR